MPERRNDEARAPPALDSLLPQDTVDKALSFAKGLLVGAGTGLVVGAGIALLPEIGVAVGVIGALNMLENVDELYANLDHLWHGVSTQEEWEARGKALGGILGGAIGASIVSNSSYVLMRQAIAEDASIPIVTRQLPKNSRFTSNELGEMAEELSTEFGFTRTQEAFATVVGEAVTNRLDGAIAADVELGTPRLVLQVKNIGAWDARSVRQLVNTMAFAEETQARTVLMLREGTPLPSPRLDGGLGTVILNAVSDGRITVLRF